METIRIPEKMRIFDGAALKWIAVITMLIDHSAKGLLYLGYLRPRAPLKKGTYLYDLYLVYRNLRGVGRIAFPIFCFFLVQGFLYTRNRRKYAIRLFLFALISEVPFDLALYENVVYKSHQNVYFTLFLGLIMLWGMDSIQERVKPVMPSVLLQAAVAGALMYLAYRLKTDYNFKGLALILVFYLLHFFHPLACLGGAIAIYWEWPWVLLAFPPLLLYNGKRGKQRKYLFYAIYPAHLIIIWIIRMMMLTFRPA